MDSACPSDSTVWKEFDLSVSLFIQMSVPMSCDAWKTNCVGSHSWSDHDADTCSEYKDNDYCTVDGDEGKKWKKAWGPFSAYANLGKDAHNCPECGCTEPVWQSWEAWGSCSSSTCQQGVEERTRPFSGGCSGKFCYPPPGEEKQTRICTGAALCRNLNLL